jgi:CheY-like chemotaxis protein
VKRNGIPGSHFKKANSIRNRKIKTWRGCYATKLESQRRVPMTNTILIVDDNEDLRKMLAWLLQPRGYETLQAATGKDAIERAITAQPSLILLDIRLPDMNGVDAARAIKKDQRTAHIPIVGWSAYFGER